MKHLLPYCMLFAMVLSCGSNKVFTEQDNKDYQKLQDLVASKSFEIVSNSAMPIASASFSKVANSRILGPGNSAGNIDISSNSNRLVVKGDSIRGFLPFYGDQNFGGGYNRNHSGIEFNAIPEDYKVSLDDKKHAVNIRFKIADQYRSSERYDIIITLYPNHKSNIRVQSTNRSSIEYTGRVSKLEDAKE
ncbi:DUF4251 domain-containing protein [Gelidibacter sp.]|uniref:DUF4251 domain-containing protein n=1 Tax=Gelidibacter sp. TaxID=2018083 RepID=UPI002D15049F|nr:DUF4251 domain-containing protein [Gelidibacter sp.]HUH27723.1 DUF4251 domain-containing protein [Gelidibacter sp.]